MTEPRLDSSYCGGLSRRHRRTAILLAGAVGAWLVPWSAVLAVKLPPSTTAHRWATAWAGLDLAEAAAAGTTALFLKRHDRRAALSAGALGALLCCDAWFDICTSQAGAAQAIATAEAIAFELPLAFASFHLGLKLTMGSVSD
jgi:hypothetical protein